MYPPIHALAEMPSVHTSYSVHGEASTIPAMSHGPHFHHLHLILILPAVFQSHSYSVCFRSLLTYFDFKMGIRKENLLLLPPYLANQPPWP